MALRRGTLSIETDDEDCLSKNIKCDAKIKAKSDAQYVRAPIDKCGVVGRWFRHKLLDGILVGTPVILTIQKHRTPARNVLMKTLSFLGTEDFYTILFLCLLWICDQRLGRLFGFLLWLGFYTTGFLKSLLCLPRPPCPPVIPLEKAFDWALPSHHSLLGVIMPWYIWLYSTLHYELSPLNLSIICTLIVLWSFGVLLSRLYLGVHSPADIVCGGIVGVIVLSAWMQVDDYVDFYISQQRLEPQLKLLALLFLLLCIHPTAGAGNPSFLDTCVVHGVICGVILARSQRSRLLGFPPLLETLSLSGEFSTAIFLKFSFLRILLGGISIILLRICLKFIFIHLVQHVYRYLGLSTFNSSSFRKAMPPNPKHYTEDFKIPPIYDNETDNDHSEENDSAGSGDVISSNARPFKDHVIDEESREPKWFNFIQICDAVHSLASKSGSQQPWDVTIPVKMVVYCTISYFAVEILPQIFMFLGI